MVVQHRYLSLSVIFVLQELQVPVVSVYSSILLRNVFIVSLHLALLNKGDDLSTQKALLVVTKSFIYTQRPEAQKCFKKKTNKQTEEQDILGSRKHYG